MKDTEQILAALEQQAEAAGLPDDAAPMCRALLAALTDPVDLVRLGKILEGLGEFWDAETAYRKAIEIDPDLASAYVALGLLQLEEGASVEAIAPLARAVALEPESADRMTILAVAYAANGQPSEGIAWLRRALAADPH